MKAEAQKALEEEEMSLAQVLSEKSIRWQLISICLMMLCQQLSGINAVFFYTNKIFDAAGYAESTQLKLSGLAQNLYTVFGLHVLWVFFQFIQKILSPIIVLIGALNVAMTFISMSLMEKMGRKSLMVWGYGIMIFL